MASGVRLTTERLVVRAPVQTDRSRFVELFTDASFMVFAGVCDQPSAHARFDRMIHNATQISFSKRPIIEQSTDTIVGYVGVAPFSFEGGERLEFGYRLCTEARGKGYATEAALLLLDHTSKTWKGVLLAMIDPTNAPSINVIGKVGFEFWKQATIDGYLTNLYQLNMSRSTST